MARPGKNPNDPRNRYAHAAYDVTYGGVQMERGVSGRNTLLGGTYRAAYQFTADAGVAGAQIVGDMPMGVWIDGFVLHAPLTSGTYSLTLRGTGTDSDIVLIDALTGDLTVDGPVTLDVPVYLPTARTRPLVIAITGGTAGETVIASLLATSAETGWK